MRDQKWKWKKIGGLKVEEIFLEGLKRKIDIFIGIKNIWKMLTNALRALFKHLKVATFALKIVRL